MFSFLPLRILYVPCYFEVSLDFKLKRIKKKNPKDFSKHFVSDELMELTLKHKCTFIWCYYHLNIPFCVILQYIQSKREILRQKEKQCSVKLHIFFRILCRMNIYFNRLVICQSGITMNITTRNLSQCYLIFNLS